MQEDEEDENQGTRLKEDMTRGKQKPAGSRGQEKESWGRIHIQKRGERKEREREDEYTTNAYEALPCAYVRYGTLDHSSFYNVSYTIQTHNDMAFWHGARNRFPGDRYSDHEPYDTLSHWHSCMLFHNHALGTCRGVQMGLSKFHLAIKEPI